MNPFTVVSYCQNNLPSLPSLPSTLLQRRSSSGVVNVVVHTSPGTPRKPLQQPQQPISHSPHTTINDIITEEDEKNQKPEVPAVRPRNNPQAILPEFENDINSFFPSSQDIDETEKALINKNRHSIHTIPVSAANDTLENQPRQNLQRSTSFHTVHTTPAAPERASLDIFDRARILKSSSADAIQATTMVSQPRPMHLRHLRSNSSPPLPASSPTMKPPVQSPSLLSISTPNIPAVASEASNEDSTESENEQQEQENAEGDRAVEDDDSNNNKVEKEEKDQPISQAPEVKVEPAKPSLVTTPPTPTQNVPLIPASTSQPTVEQKMLTPPSPVVAPVVQNIPQTPSSPVISSTVTQPSNAALASSPATPPVTPPTPSAPQSTASSFLSSWQGRSRTMIPTIPRPSPLMSFSAARSVVSSVTSAGTGLLPTKEKLESIPMANRILKHPVMDSTLSYIATKAEERGISLGLNTKNLIAPEDVPYRKLNKNMVQQAMTLSVLAVQKEEQSKATDDEAGDDAFELYLSSVNTLLHALPFETCDPLRKEAFGIQLRNFMEAYLDQEFEGGYLSDTGSSAKLRRKSRRRHRRYHEQAATMIQQHTSVDENVVSEQRNQQKRQRKQRREQHAKEKQALKKKKQQMEKELEKELKNMKNQKQSKQSSPSIAPQQTKSSRRDSSSSVQANPPPQRHSRSRRRHRNHNADQHENIRARGNNGLSDTIISTAVTSAIRLKQSPIPDVVKSCLQTSKTIFNKVDERFHLQDKAWEISKSSIEKAIELDEQYAIHEVVTETMFATLTGLVKAGIAYKETPSYSTLKANSPGSIEGSSAPLLTSGRSQNPQEINPPKKSQESARSKRHSTSRDFKQVDNATEKRGLMGSWGRKSVAPVVESESDYDSDVDSGEEYDSDRSDESSTTSLRSSEVSSDQDSDEGETDNTEEVIELNNQTLRSKLVSTSGGREKIDMFSALRGAASLVYNTL